MRKLGSMALAIALVMALVPVGAEAKRITSSVSLDVVGIIDRHGGVTYAFGGEIGAHFTFACMADRTVTLFRVEPNGSATQVATANSEFGQFVGNLERPLSQITGSYYAEVAPVTRKFKRGRYRKLRCLGARSPTIFVDVPDSLLTSPP